MQNDVLTSLDMCANDSEQLAKILRRTRFIRSILPPGVNDPPGGWQNCQNENIHNKCRDKFGVKSQGKLMQSGLEHE